MNDTSPDSLNADALPEDAPYLAATTLWLERAVIGLNLCPFARAPHVQGKLRMRVSHARNTDALLDELCGELQSLNALTPDECETGLLIHPFVLTDFLDYNDFLDVADAAVQTLGLEGEWQVASFHPDYQFADSAPDDIENFSNRSPYPTLHLLRESSIERAMDVMSDTDSIYQFTFASADAVMLASEYLPRSLRGKRRPERAVHDLRSGLLSPHRGTDARGSCAGVADPSRRTWHGNPGQG